MTPNTTKAATINSLVYIPVQDTNEPVGQQAKHIVATDLSGGGGGGVITTLSEFRASNDIPTNAVVTITDYGGGSWHYIGLNDGEYVDDTVNKIITADNRVWGRVGIPRMDVTRFGAILDGNFDNINVFINIINYANGTGGNVDFLFPSGTFYMSTAAAVPAIKANGVSFSGYGNSSIIKLTSGTYFRWDGMAATSPLVINGGGLNGLNIIYSTPDSVTPSCILNYAAAFVFSNVNIDNCCTFFQFGTDTTHGAYNIKFSHVTAVIANAGKPFIKIIYALGFYWDTLDTISPKSPIVPAWNTTSVMNTVPGTNVIDIVGSCDTLEIRLFAEKMYRVINGVLDGNFVVVNIRLFNSVIDYCRDSIVNFELRNNATVTNLEIKNNYMCTWEGDAIYLYINGSAINGLRIHGNNTLFTGKSAINIDTVDNVSVKGLRTANNNFKGSSRVDVTIPTVRIDAISDWISIGDTFGAPIYNGDFPWVANKGLSVGAFNTPNDVIMLASSYMNYTGEVHTGIPIIPLQLDVVNETSISSVKLSTLDVLELRTKTTLEENVTFAVGYVFKTFKNGVGLFEAVEITSDGRVKGSAGTENNDFVTKSQLDLKKADASPDTAAAAAGAAPTKLEFDALLGEVRDLKTKLRAAPNGGLLA